MMFGHQKSIVETLRRVLQISAVMFIEQKALHGFTVLLELVFIIWGFEIQVSEIFSGGEFCKKFVEPVRSIIA